MGIFGRKRAKESVNDPVCGMVLVKAEAVGPDVISGEAYYYCSVACQDTHHEATGTRRSRRERNLERELTP